LRATLAVASLIDKNPPGMDVVILAAGYATRLYPLTLTRPKALLEVAGTPIIERVIGSLRSIPGIARFVIVTNDKFAGALEEWAAGYRTAHRDQALLVVSDGSTDESNRLGAIGDLGLALTRCGIEDDLIVVASDNLFSAPLQAFGEYCVQRRAPVVALYDVGNLEAIRKYNAITADAAGRITFFEEKPAHPQSTRTAIALYYYPRHVLPLIAQYLADGHNPDQPGRLVQWLYPRVPFYTWELPGLWCDVGSEETLHEANRIFGTLGTQA
jgi:glucose-1-phosphate thymidylyltransferase